MQVQHIRKYLFISKRIFSSSKFEIKILFRWPSDKSDGLGTTSRVNQTASCDVSGDALTSITDPTEDNVRQYFQSAMSQCLSTIAVNRKSRALIFLGNEYRF